MSEPNFSTNTYIVPANSVYLVGSLGNFIINLTAGTVVASLTVQLGNGRTTRFDAYDNYTMPDGETFEFFTVTNTTGSDITVKIGVGQGKIGVANAVTVTGVVSTTLTPGATMQDSADVTVAAGATTKVITGNANNKTAIFTNIPTNGTPVRYGTSAAAAARGDYLANGVKAGLDTQADVWIYNPSASPITITWLILKV